MTTDSQSHGTAAFLQQMLTDADPKMTATRDIISGIHAGVVAGSLNQLDVMVLLAGAVASLERRLVDLEDGRGDTEAIGHTPPPPASIPRSDDDPNPLTMQF